MKKKKGKKKGKKKTKRKKLQDNGKKGQRK